MYIHATHRYGLLRYHLAKFVMYPHGYIGLGVVLSTCEQYEQQHSGQLNHTMMFQVIGLSS